MVFKQGADVLSSDSLISMTNYQGTRDTSLVQESSGNNYGSRTTLLVGVLGSGKVRDALLRHDLSAIAGKYRTIESLKLRLHVDAVTDTNTSMVMGVALERAGNAGWIAGTANGTAQSGSACWNYAVSSAGPWLGGTNGARGSLDHHGIVGSAIIDNTTAPAGSWIEIPLTPVANDPEVDTLTKIVDLWNRNGGSENAGLLLVYQSLTGYPQWQFSSSENTDLTCRPELAVEFTPLDAYGLWAGKTGLTEAGVDDPMLDPDHDGVVNILECLLGGEPLDTDDRAKQPFGLINGDRFIVRYRLSPAGVHLAPVVETGNNLVDWHSIVAGTDGIEISAGPADSDNTPTVDVSFPASGWPTRFVRLDVSRF